ncbi:MAG: MBL fold metallo-hydrolase [Flavobacteriales bacterium]
MVTLKVLGSGDAFGTGGIPNTCFHLSSSEHGILIDCGATSLVQLKKYGLDSNAVDSILVSHFHGDHYGGIPFLMLEAALVHQRKKPLRIIGPEGIQEKLIALQDALYPGTSEHMDQLDLHFSSFREKSILEFNEFSLNSTPVLHAPASHPHALRITVEGKVIAFSGDTSWTDELYDIADGADLFICECNFLDQRSPAHIHYKELKEKASGIRADRLVLTHLGGEMLRSSVDHECLVEGQEIQL